MLENEKKVAFAYMVRCAVIWQCQCQCQCWDFFPIYLGKEVPKIFKDILCPPLKNVFEILQGGTAFLIPGFS